MKIIIMVCLLFYIYGCASMKSIENRYDIYSIKNQSEIKGYFVIGCGSLYQKEYYFLFVKYNGGYKRIAIPTEKTIIYEKDINPYLYIRTYYPHGTLEEILSNPAIEISITVPKGTIISKYIIN